MRLSIILTGYYFKYFDLYKKIILETNLYDNIEFNLFILSHKKEEEIQDNILNYLIKNKWQIIYQPNIGWDWGCYVQFMKWIEDQDIDKPDYLLFLHDDINIDKNGFIQEFLNKINCGYKLIGNSKPFTTINHFEKNYSDEAFILKKHRIDYEPNKIEIVRGSVFFISYNLAQQTLKNLPFQNCGTINLANRSLRMFGAIATKLIGNDKISYLSNEHFRSDYITEEMRGNNVGRFFFIKRQIESILNKFYFFVEKYFVSNLIYKHNYPLQEDKIIKINITDEFFLQGFLNLSLVRNNCSDISFDELEKILSRNIVGQIKITSKTIFSNLNVFKNLFIWIEKSLIPVDIFIDTNNISKKEINQFKETFSHIKIRTEFLPKRKIYKFTKQLYINSSKLNNLSYK